MTACNTEDTTAAAAQAAGMAAARQHEQAAEAQHRASGSVMVTENATTPDDVAVPWLGSGSNAATASLSPSTPTQPGQRRQHDGPPAA